jgi:hypothetical protein
MKFKPARRKNPFDNLVLRLLTHGAASAAAIVAVSTSVTERTLLPLYLAGVFISVLEGIWLYFNLRR